MSNVKCWNPIVFIINCCCHILESGLRFFQHIKCATNKVTIANPSDHFKPSLRNFKFDNIPSFVIRQSSFARFVLRHSSFIVYSAFRNPHSQFLIPHPRVYQGVNNIHHQRDGRHHQRKDDDDPLNGRVISQIDPFQQQPPHAGPGKGGLG